MISVYERSNYLLGFPELIGKPITLQYLPTKRSRKWRDTGTAILSWQGDVQYLIRLVGQMGWDSVRVVER